MLFGLVISPASRRTLAGQLKSQLKKCDGLGFVAPETIVIGQFYRDVADIFAVSLLSALPIRRCSWIRWAGDTRSYNTLR